jgi:hypothetical protein
MKTLAVLLMGLALATTSTIADADVCDRHFLIRTQLEDVLDKQCDQITDQDLKTVTEIYAMVGAGVSYMRNRFPFCDVAMDWDYLRRWYKTLTFSKEDFAGLDNVEAFKFTQFCSGADPSPISVSFSDKDILTAFPKLKQIDFYGNYTYVDWSFARNIQKAYLNLPPRFNHVTAINNDVLMAWGSPEALEELTIDAFDLFRRARRNATPRERLSDLTPEALSRFVNLETLTLKYRFESLDSDVFAKIKLPELRNLKIITQDLDCDTCPPDEFSINLDNFPKLDEFWLMSTPAQNTLNLTGKLPRFSYLELGPFNGSLSNQPALEELSLFTKDLDIVIENNPLLRKLKLDTRIAAKASLHLNSLPSLKGELAVECGDFGLITISNTEIDRLKCTGQREKVPEDFELRIDSNPQLSELILNNTDITLSQIEGDISRLEKVSLRSNQIIEIPLSEIERFFGRTGPNFKELNLCGNRLSPQTIADFTKLFFCEDGEQPNFQIFMSYEGQGCLPLITSPQK